VQSLRSYLEKLETIHPDHLARVGEPVDWQYEVTANVEKVSKRNNNPALFFERIKGYSTPLVVNLFGHMDRINLALKGASHRIIDRLDFYDEWNRLINREVTPVWVDGGPVKDICCIGEDVDLATLPIVKFYEQDAGRYITSGLLVARDPDNPEAVNLSYARMQLKGRNRLGTSLHSRGNMWHYFERSKALGKPMDVAIIIGAHPALYLAAAAKITNEYAVTGSLIGEPVELVKSETVDLPIPSQAEIVLEGKILLDEEDEGPFNEYTGYLSGRSTRNIIHVSALTKRRDSIYMTIAPSNSDEHLLLSGLPKQARIYRSMKDFLPMPALRNIYWPIAGTHFVCFISLEKSRSSTPGLAKQAALLLMGLDPYVKIVAVFSEDIDISNITDSLRAIASMSDLRIGSDIEILRGVFTHRLDPSSREEGVSSKIIIDATGPEIEAAPYQSNAEALDKLRLRKVEEISFPNVDDPRLCVAKVGPDFDDPRGLLQETILNQCRLVIIVDEDVDIFNSRQVLWALATRFQPAEHIIAINGKLGIDATKPKTWKAIRATIPPEARKSLVHR